MTLRGAYYYYWHTLLTLFTQERTLTLRGAYYYSTDTHC
jgi:hypothetical protein